MKVSIGSSPITPPPMSPPNTVPSSPPREALPSVPPRRNIICLIPNSSITLDIILNEAKPLAASAINATLSGTMAEARKNSQSDIIEGVFRYLLPAAPAAALDDTEQEREQEEQTGGGEEEAEFGIAGEVFTDELTWGDIVVVLQRLQELCEGERGIVG